MAANEYDMKTLNNGNVEIKIKDPIKVFKTQKMSITKDARDVAVIIQMNPVQLNTTPLTKNGSTISPNSVFQDYYAYGSPFYATDYNKPLVTAIGSTGTLSATVSNTYNNSYSCNITVGVAKIKAAVGFSVTDGSIVSASTSVPTNGVYTKVVGYEYDYVQAFEVVNWVTGHTDAVGYAFKPAGATFITYH
ncbi:hypothetical protein ACPUYX_05800 [Desulfosporosinus sp. SYSU MS00001]|uniref:hypothetical protein n=1 Tax=Desulfosporosinus sp. SYSU MS00001 TaxID=3416284 RepID=UPI003CEF4839